MRKTLTLVLVAVAVGMLAAGGAWAAKASEAPETVVLDDCAAKKPAVTFPHAAHVGLTECSTCHHTNEGLTAASDVEVQPCSACHLNPESPDVPNMAEMSLKKNPFHISCIGCHKTEAKGPTTCNDCHAGA